MFVVFRRLWFWCCLLLLLKQNDRSCNCDFCWRRSVRSFLAKWSSSDSELLCMCSTKNARCLMEAEHFCSIVAVSIPFLLFEILIIEKIRISFHDISKIHICDALSWWTKVKDSTKWLVVSKPLQWVYEFLSRDGYWLSTTRLIVVYRVVGRQGVDCLFDRSHH